MLYTQIEDKTVVFISYGLTAAKMGDKIYMLEQGAVIEQGSHEELMAQQGKYAYFFELQGRKYAV